MKHPVGASKICASVGKENGQVFAAFFIFAQLVNPNRMLKQVGFLSMVFVLTAFCGYGQSVRKKMLGIYSGTIPPYIIESGEQLINVAGASISIVFLSENKVEETIGAAKTEGTYRITSDDKATYTIQVNYPNQVVYEELVLSKKDKTILRKGFYPQPESKLTKI